jgi:hypothetical protein
VACTGGMQYGIYVKGTGNMEHSGYHALEKSDVHDSINPKVPMSVQGGGGRWGRSG